MALSKRTNARLQLAAALIEADNETLFERAALESERARDAGHEPSSSTLPAPKLASESAVFAPYRRHDRPLPHARSRSSLVELQTSSSDGRRPSMDFIGVALPSEQRRPAHLRAVSLTSRPRSSFESGRAFSTTGGDDIEEIAFPVEEDDDTDGNVLEGWGIEKYLDSEERQRIEQRRSRRSFDGYATRLPRPRTHSAPMTAPPGSVAATAPRRLSRADRASADPALLAKIRSYREAGGSDRGDTAAATAEETTEECRAARLGGRSRGSTLLDPSFDPYGHDRDATTRYPGVAQGVMNMQNRGEEADDEDDDDIPIAELRKRLPAHGLTTTQLQTLARRNRMPASCGEAPADARSSVDTRRSDATVARPDFALLPYDQSPHSRMQRRPSDTASLPKAGSTSKWKNVLRFGKSNTAPANEGASSVHQEDTEVDWRQAGPLQARGLDARQPKTLVMPSLLSRGSGSESGALGSAGSAPQQYVPPGFVLHDGHGLPPILATRTAAAARPPGLGGRSVSSTAELFRNQLVQKDDEREGWGSAAVVGETETSQDQGQGSPSLAAGKPKARSGASDYAYTRVTRGQSSGGSESSGEDEPTSGSEAEDAERWIDDRKPAGKLYGRSLMDVAEERMQHKATAKRFYGESNLSQDAAPQGNARSGDGATPDFAERPLGVNDTKERMETLFGRDEIWARELQAREEADQRDKEAAAATALQQRALVGQVDASEAEESPAEPARIVTSAPPLLDVDVSRIYVGEDTTQWLARDSDDTDDSHSDDGSKSEENAGRRKSLTLQHVLDATSGRSRRAPSISVTGSDDSEDIPLSQLPMRPRTVSRAAQESDDEEEVPLSQVLQRQLEGARTKPQREGGGMRVALIAVQPGATKSTSDDDDDDAPLGLVHPHASTKTAALAGHWEQDADDMPLGIAHPQAAIIAEQAALIKQLQSQIVHSGQHTALPWQMPPMVLQSGKVQAVTPPLPALDGAFAPAMSPLVDVAPKATRIDQWRNDVPAEAPASVPSIPSS